MTGRVPTVVSRLNGQDCQMDLYNYRFHKKREIYLDGVVDGEMMRRVTAQLRYLDEKEKADIYLYINSPGGSVVDGMAIFDCIRSAIESDVVTIASGMAASMGAFLLAAGAKGKRYAAPHAEIMIHQPLGGARGQASDIRIHAENILRTKAMLDEILAEQTGRSVEEIERDTDRDHFMSPEEALEYGLIDKIGFPFL